MYGKEYDLTNAEREQEKTAKETSKQISSRENSYTVV